MVSFISLISRSDQPLYIQLFLPGSNDPATANEFLKFNFLSHMGLDVFSSPTSLTLREQQQQHQSNQGVAPIYLLLFIQDGILVYGYETNNGLKILVGLVEPETTERLNQLFLKIHKCYLRAVCNPFNGGVEDADKSIENSATFDRNLKQVVAQWLNHDGEATQST